MNTLSGGGRVGGGGGCRGEGNKGGAHVGCVVDVFLLLNVSLIFVMYISSLTQHDVSPREMTLTLWTLIHGYLYFFMFSLKHFLHDSGFS